MSSTHFCLDVDAKTEEVERWYQVAIPGDILVIHIPWYKPGFVQLHRSTPGRVLWNACPGRGATMAFEEALGRLQLLQGNRGLARSVASWKAPQSVRRLQHVLDESRRLREEV